MKHHHLQVRKGDILLRNYLRINPWAFYGLFGVVLEFVCSRSGTNGEKCICTNNDAPETCRCQAGYAPIGNGGCTSEFSPQCLSVLQKGKSIKLDVSLKSSSQPSQLLSKYA